MPEDTGATNLEAAVPETTGDNIEDAAQEPEVVEEKPKVVPLAALEDERRKRQEYQQRLDEVARENAYYRETMLKPKEEANKPNPDDIVTFRDVEKYFDDKYNKLNNEQRGRRVNAQLTDARRTVEDFNEVWDVANQLASEKPYLSEIFLREENPVMAAYEYAKNSPSYTARRETMKTKETVDKINKNLSKPGTLTDAGGSKVSTLNEEERIRKMSKKEFDDYYNNLLIGKTSLPR